MNLVKIVALIMKPRIKTSQMVWTIFTLVGSHNELSLLHQFGKIDILESRNKQPCSLNPHLKLSF